MGNGQIQHEFLTVKEAAHILRMTYRFFGYMLRSGNGPPYTKFGSHIRIPRDAFMEWATNGENKESPRSIDGKRKW